MKPCAANCRQLAPTAGLSFCRESRGRSDCPSWTIPVTFLRNLPKRGKLSRQQTPDLDTLNQSQKHKATNGFKAAREFKPLPYFTHHTSHIGG